MKRAIKAGLIVSFLFVCVLLIKSITGTFAIYRDVLNTKIYLTVAEPGDYTLRFYDGNTLVDTYARTANQAIGAFPTNPTKAGYNFTGWYTDPTGGTKVKPTDIVTASDDYYARWVKIVCMKETDSTKLHTEKCTSGASCNTKAHYAVGADLVYGQISQQTVPALGDAYNCDVNADDVFKSDTERFYFIRKGSINDEETASLVMYSSIDEDGIMEDEVDPVGKIYPYTSVPDILPVPSGDQTIPDDRIFSNPGLIQFGSHAARLLDLDDFHAAIGGTGTTYGNDGSSLPSSPNSIFIFEHTRFQSTTKGRSGIWLQDIEGQIYRIQTSSWAINNQSNADAVRPVIEIPYTAIEGYVEKTSYNVIYNTMGGNTIPSVGRYEGEEIGALPTPTRQGFNFLGWYTTAGYVTQVTPSMIISSNTTIYAKWEEQEEEMEYVFYIPGTCTFTSTGITSASDDCVSIINPTGSDINYVGSNRYIDTQIALYNLANFNKDYEVGFTINEYASSSNEKQATLFNSKIDLEAAKWPGINFRRQDNNSRQMNISSTVDMDNHQIKNIPITDPLTTNDTPFTVVLKREGKDYSYSINGGAMTLIQTASDNQDLFDLPAWFGAAASTTSRTVTTSGAMRYFTGTLSNMYIKLGVEEVVPQTVTFDGDSPTTIEFSSKTVNKGSQVGHLPTVTKSGFAFDGWYTAPNGGGTKVTESTIITDDIIFYANYKSIFLVTFDGHDGTVSITPNVLEVVDGESIGTTNLPTASLTGYAFDGWYTTENGNIKVTGSEIITADVTYHARYLQGYTITFVDNGADTIEYITKVVPFNTPIGSLPTATKANNTFEGWYKDSGFNTLVDPTETLSGDTIFYARWRPADAVAEVNKTYYTTLQAAADAITTNDLTTIYVLADIEDSRSGNQACVLNLYTDGFIGKNIILDLQEHTIEYKGAAKVYVIRSKANLEIKNGTIKSTADGAAAVESNAGTLVINSGRIEQNNNRHAVYNDGGTVTIGGTTELVSKATGNFSNVDRATIANFNGTMYIVGGTIINTLGPAVANGRTSRLTIGDATNGLDITTPVMQGATYGLVVNSGTVYVNGGIFKGKTRGIQDTTKTTPLSGTSYNTSDTEPIGSDTYHLAYLYNTATPSHTYNFNANGGTVSPDHINVNVGDSLTSGDMPTPTFGSNIFDGWYTDSGLNTPVTYPISPSATGITTFYAKWNTPAVNTVVSFNNVNPAMQTYYANIGTWKNSSSNFPSWSDSNKASTWALDATENTVMMQNFNANNCQCADNQCTSSGTVECDKPLGYDTGTNAAVNVFLYDEVNEIKGAQVTYAKATNGVIYNLIPNQVYKWELASDPNTYGFVKFTGERRILNTGDVRNTRDLGGLPVDTDGNGTIDGHLDYGRLFRGIRLPSSNSVTELTNLGINSELDLRESNSDTNQISRYNRIEAQNYYVNPFTTANHTPLAAETTYYNMTRAAVKYAMQEIVANKNLYFHCRIGTDRTGTVAWVLEGLLGVPEEERIQDYELSFFYGLVRIHRYHNQKPGSNVGTGHERFTYMHDFMPTNTDIYNWYMFGSTNTAEDNQLINDFRAAMIVSN